MPTYWDEQRSKHTFEDAAYSAKRMLYPELYFSEVEPSIAICRVCQGEGYHKPECKLRSPDGKSKPLVEDLFEAAGDKEKELKPLIEVERERLKALDMTPTKAEKVKQVITPQITTDR